MRNIPSCFTRCIVLLLLHVVVLCQCVHTQTTDRNLQDGILVYSANKACELVSLAETNRIQVTLFNSFDFPIELVWINFEGERRSYGTIEAGGRHEQSTYARHPWAIQDLSGETLYCVEFTSAGEYKLGHSTWKPSPDASVVLPTRVDNSVRKYFPPIIKQHWNTCSQQSALHYIFAYEMNYQRNAYGLKTANQYPATWSWNFVNNGVDQGSELIEGWHVAREMGVPSVDDYGQSGSKGTSGWMSGYDLYHRAMKNRVSNWEFFRIDDEVGLDRAKTWLYNHGNPELSVGGLLAIDFPPTGHVLDRIPAGDYESGKTIVKQWGEGGGHLMTYVGYDDQVGYDFNGDGSITNDQDITGDGEVTIADWERGAFIMVNSWGEHWADRGMAYVPYRSHFAQEDWHRGEWLAQVRVRAKYEPMTTLRITMACDDRSRLRLALQLVGADGAAVESWSPLLFSTDPILDAEGIEGPEGYSSFLSEGRSVAACPLRGHSDERPIEMGFDLSAFATAFLDHEGGTLELVAFMEEQPADSQEEDTALDKSGSGESSEPVARLSVSDAAVLRYNSTGTLLGSVSFEGEAVAEPSVVYRASIPISALFRLE